jgi:hypothetical protein
MVYVDYPLMYFEYLQAVEHETCPNGASKCLGIERCVYNKDGYPSDYVKCDLKKKYGV